MTSLIPSLLPALLRMPRTIDIYIATDSFPQPTLIAGSIAHKSTRSSSIRQLVHFTQLRPVEISFMVFDFTGAETY
jgi:hypothetical protein